MNFLDSNTLIAISGAVAAVGGAILTVQKILNNLKKAKKEEAERILQQAHEAVLELKVVRDAEFVALKAKVDALEESVEKDLAHLKETYNGEIRNLGSKIEDLRQELRNQYTQMVGLLQKMIEKD